MPTLYFTIIFYTIDLQFAVVEPDVWSNAGMSFRRYRGVKLQNYLIKSILSGSSVIACLKVCAVAQDCFSVNFFELGGVCELNGYNDMLSDLSTAAGLCMV